MASLFDRRSINMRAAFDFSHLEPSVQKHLRNVYTTLCVCTLTAAVGAWVHLSANLFQGGLLTSLVALGCLITLGCVKHTAKNLKMRFGFLCGFTFFMGMSIGPMLDLAADISPQLIPSAFLLTAAIFISLTLCATLTKSREFLFLGSMLFSALAVLSLLRLIYLFAPTEALLDVQLYGGLLVFCGFVLFDTQFIVEKRRYGDDDFIWHAVDLFIDALDMFIRILAILVKKEKKRE